MKPGKTGIKKILFVLFLAALAWFLRPVPEWRLDRAGALRILASDGDFLRQFRSEYDGSFAESVPLSGYPESLIRGIIRAEDSRFRYHPGFDIIAIVRAMGQDLSSGRVVSGGSTITQQLVRIIWMKELPENLFCRKIVEILLALRLELWFSKDRILEAYVNQIPSKYNSRGFAAAARRLFERDVRYLTAEQEVALIILTRQPHSTRKTFIRRFQNLWRSLYGERQYHIEDVLDRVFSGNRPDHTPDKGSRHFSDWIHSLESGIRGDVLTSISSELNNRVTSIVQNELGFLREYNTSKAAVVVLELPEGPEGKYFRLVAMVGSDNYDDTNGGQVNGAFSVREAGSTLKPFLYGLAMDKLGLLPCSIISDKPRTYPLRTGETYIPRNYDLKFMGDITIRKALSTSRNIPAVDMVSRLGVPEFYRYLKKWGFSHMEDDPDHYGYGLALGTGGARLLQLAALYASVANRGGLLPVYIGKLSDGRILSYGRAAKVMSEKSSYYITSILSDMEARNRGLGGRGFLDFPFDVAVKTGTSKDFRDAWTVGFSGKYVVGVWTGNFTGEPMKRVCGAWGAGRIFQQVMRLLAGKERFEFSYPESFQQVRLCMLSGRIPGPECRRTYTELLDIHDMPTDICSGVFERNRDLTSSRPEILSPSHGEEFIIDPTVPVDFQKIPVRIILPVSGGAGEYVIHIDKRIFPLSTSYETTISPSRGGHEIRLFRDKELIDAVEFTVH